MASLGELFIELGVQADTETLKNVSDTVKGLRNGLLLVAGAFTGAVVALDRFVDGSLQGVVALKNLNAQTGLSIEKLQKFQQAGQLSNLAISADQIAQSIGNVQKNIADIQLGGGNLAPFQLLGIDPLGQDAFSVIDQLRDSIKNIDPAIATNLVSQLGLSPDFINLLRLSREEFEKLSENTFLNKKQRGDIDRLGTSIKQITLNFKALKDQAVAKLAPQLNEIVQQFFKWLKDNGDKIIRTITSIARGIASFASAIGNAFRLMGRFIEGVTGLENGIKILAVAFTALSISFSPFLAGLTAVVLLLDDISMFKSGGDSLIGDLVEAFKDLPNLSKVLLGAGGIAVLAKVVSNIGTLGTALKSLSGLAVILSPITAFMVAAVAFANAPSWGKKLGEIASETEVGRNAGDFLFRLKEAPSIDAALGFVGLGPSSVSPSINVTNNNNVSITGGNAQENERAFSRSNAGINENSLKSIEAGQGRGIR